MTDFISLEAFLQTTNPNKNIEKQAGVSIPAAPAKANSVELLTPPSSLSDEFLSGAKRQNGIIERIADKIKNISGLGFGSKKLQGVLEKSNDTKEKESAVHKYKLSQENAAQAAADTASSAASIGTFFFIKQAINTNVAKKFKINPDNLANKLKDVKSTSAIITFVQKNIDKKSTAIVLGALGAAFVGGFAKSVLLKLNRIGTKQYKPEITEDMDAKEKRAVKKKAKKEKSNANFRNFASGFINGISTPLLLAAGTVGTPLYVALNSLSRYFIASREDKGQKNLKNYIENLKTSPITNAASALAIALPAAKSAKFNKVFDENLDKVVNNLRNTELNQSTRLKTTYEQLEDIILGNAKIKEIVENPDLTTSQKIEELTKENMFAVKFKQICADSDDLTIALKEACPSSRSFEEANALVQNVFKGEYTLTKQVGVGTVAETYLAKDKSGKEVCIKMIKDGISAEKIAKDREKFLQMIDAMADKSPEEKTFLKANVENIAKGVLDEVNLENEMNAAKKLAEATTKAKVVKPIKVADNIYVMEKADGISLQSFINTSSLKRQLEWVKWDVERYIKWSQEEPDNIYVAKALERAKEKLANIEQQLASQPPELSEAESKKLFESYQDVLVEQFNKVDKGGKTIHGDIHPGNIFIDVDALKRGDKQFLTLIDTGNTIAQTPESVLRFLNLTKYIQDGDCENIASFVLEGAALPQGMTIEKAREEVAKQLKQVLFDDKTHIGPISNDAMLAITDDIMQKLNIIPSDTQGNLLKSKNSANKSLEGFADSYIKAVRDKLNKKLEDIASKNGKSINELSKAEKAKVLGVATTSYTGAMATMAKMPAKQKLQEQKNLLHLSAKDRLSLKKSKSTPKKNSQEYLNYIIKQAKKPKNPAVENILNAMED